MQILVLSFIDKYAHDWKSVWDTITPFDSVIVAVAKSVRFLPCQLLKVLAGGLHTLVLGEVKRYQRVTIKRNIGTKGTRCRIVRGCEYSLVSWFHALPVSR